MLKDILLKQQEVVLTQRDSSPLHQEVLHMPKEIHHIHKLDAPSGTAITLAEELINHYDKKTEWVKGELHAPDGSVSGSREAEPQQLVINSYRQDEVPGIHTIKYNSEFDEISITHNAHNRGGFALGAVLAAEFAATHEGLLTMDDLFK